MKKKDKTNVMRLLDQRKIPYESFEYISSADVSGDKIAAELGEDPKQVFKTLVTQADNNHYVFMIPVSSELDLKKAAKAAGTKRIRMIKAKELLGLTGYVHGGCSPIGMKKAFPTFIDKSSQNFEEIFFSAGRVGKQVKVALKDLMKVIKLKQADLTEK